MTEVINVLYVFGDELRHGGIENFMMNYFRHMNKDVIHIDFVVQGEGKGVFDDEIEKADSRIYRLPKPGRHLCRYQKEFSRILQSGRYQIIHTHCDAMNFRILRLAEKCNIPVRISHSHNTQHILPGRSRLKTLYYEYSRKRLARYASVRYACSEEAGKWLYGKYLFEIIPNAIDIDKFLFRSGKRTLLRGKYGIPDNMIVLGHVGRFDVQKNQIFLLDLLKKLISKDHNKYLLFMVGDGWMQNSIKKRVKEYCLEEYIIFTGEVPNSQDYYNMMDIFLMPSLFEGYCIALEEAEVNGLPCLASQYIPKEVNVSDKITYLPLNVTVWREQILKMSLAKRRTDAAEELRMKGYDINDAAKRMQDEYIRLYQENIEEKDHVQNNRHHSNL